MMGSWRLLGLAIFIFCLLAVFSSAQISDTAAVSSNKQQENLSGPSSGDNPSGGSESRSSNRKSLAETDEVECKKTRMSGVPRYHCPNAASFYKLGTQLEDQEVEVHISQVNGGLAVPPEARLKLVVLDLHQTNTTHITSHKKVLTSLKKLNLDGNPNFNASSLLELGELPLLTVLQLAGSAKETLNFILRELLKGMPALFDLNVSEAGLHHLPLDTFQQNPKLKLLNIGGNDFVKITLNESLMQQLVDLNISKCHLQNLKVDVKSAEVPQTHLQYVDLSHNYLQSLPTSFMNLVAKNLVTLNINDNAWNKSCKLCSLYHLWSYQVEHPELVEGAQNLHCFSREEALKSCGWEECPATCTCDEGSKTVDCRNADLMTIPQLAPSDAEVLLLANNNLFNMSGIESPVWCNLQVVNADHNRITSIIPPGTKGRCICFDHDDFYEEEPDCFPQELQKLSLRNNKIKALSQTFSDCPLLYSLKELYLSDNEIKHLESHVCSSFELLEVLSLDGNNYSDLEEQDVAPYPNLKKLNLSSNCLVTLPYRLIELMPKLRVLDVSHNRIQQLSEKTRTPDTPFTPLVATVLEELDLSNNNFELINPILDLKHTKTLMNLSVDNNPWECSCEIIEDLAARVFEDLQLMAVVKAVQTIRCQQPAQLANLHINDPKALQICKGTKTENNIFTGVVGTLITLAVVGVIVYIACSKAPTFVRDALRMSSTFHNGTLRRRFSVVLVHAWEDSEMVRTDLVNPLKDLGYAVAWNDNVFPPGENNDASIERAIVNSKRMLVVASMNFLVYEQGEQIIRRGLSEEHRVEGFKVLALVLNDLPRELPYPALYEIVVRRNPVHKNSSNYISKICGFLPPPVSSYPTVYFTRTDGFLWEQLQRYQRRETVAANQQRDGLQGIFSVERPDGYSNPDGASNSSQSKIDSHDHS